jgi:hypothetical protein
MRLATETYQDQLVRWPEDGRHILAQYDDESIVVYQAYRPSIGNFATEHGYFGGDFSLGRMSWIKPNFLWMMYRSGWGTKPGQEITLAVRMKRDGFDDVLAQAVHSSYVEDLYGSREAWKEAGERSDVRLQWDPDHKPNGDKENRRAIQLGLRGETLAKYAKEWVLDIEDISEFVAEQRNRSPAELVTPEEHVYQPKRKETAAKLGLDT